MSQVIAILFALSSASAQQLAHLDTVLRWGTELLASQPTFTRTGTPVSGESCEFTIQARPDRSLEISVVEKTGTQARRIWALVNAEYPQAFERTELVSGQVFVVGRVGLGVHTLAIRVNEVGQPIRVYATSTIEPTIDCALN